MKKLTIAVLSVMTAFLAVAPAQAFPSISAPKIEAQQQQDVQQVQWRDRDRWDRRYDRRDYRRGPNAGAIIGGLAAGAIIGGALAGPRYYEPAPRYYVDPPRYSAPPRYYAPRRVAGNAHIDWCYSRYRSYRAYDNTFQPNYGPRQACYSPY
jgi:hypothetical protein